MNRWYRRMLAVGVLAGLMLPAIPGRTFAESMSGLIPITTISDAARQDFLNARILFEKIRYVDALAEFERAIARDSAFALAHLYAAVLQPTTDLIQQGVARAVRLSDAVSAGEQLFIQSIQAAVEGRIDDQRDLTRRIVETYPDDPHAHYWMGNVHQRRRQYADAMRSYERATTLDPDFFEAHNEIGYAAKAIGDIERAREAFERVIVLIPDEANPYDSYAELLMQMGRYDSSITVYEKALEINPEFVTTYAGIASDLLFLNRPDSALTVAAHFFESALDDSHRRWAMLLTAIAYVDVKRFDAALTALEKRLSIAEMLGDPSLQSQDWNLMGTIHLERGDAEQGRRCFSSGINAIRDSDLPDELKQDAEHEFLYYATRTLIEIGALNEGRKSAAHYDEVTTDADLPQITQRAFELRGLLALAEGDFATAVREIQQADLQNPRNVYRLGLAYEGLGDTASARMEFQRCADFNTISSMDLAFVRRDALARLSSAAE